MSDAESKPIFVRGRPVPDASVTPVVHYYRAEVGRGNVWRQRMDATTNWAIGASTAIVSVAFSRPDVPHVLIPIGGVLVFLLMCIEGRRYRLYDVFRSRTRLLEAHMVVPYLMHDVDLLPGGWRANLAEDLLQPSYKMSFWRATGSRLRRNYIWIFLILMLAWTARVAARTTPGIGGAQFVPTAVDAAHVYQGFAYGPLPAWAMLGLTALYFGALGAWIYLAGRSPDPDQMVYVRLRARETQWPL